jgi:hypothetical protein
MTTTDTLLTAAAILCGAAVLLILAAFAIRCIQAGREAAEDNRRIYDNEYKRPKK